jgi:hypothetical protein
MEGRVNRVCSGSGWLVLGAGLWHRKSAFKSSPLKFDLVILPPTPPWKHPESASPDCHSFLSAPTELIKIRQQSAPTNVSPTTLGVLHSIVRTEGLRGLYRGWGATAGRELAYGPYFITVNIKSLGSKFRRQWRLIRESRSIHLV